MNTISERLRNFAQGCRGSMWQSRGETIGLMDEAADTIDALVAAIEPFSVNPRGYADDDPWTIKTDVGTVRAAHAARARVKGEKP